MPNEGITDHRELITLVGDGLRDHGVRTSCLGFGDHYAEDLLSDLATHSTGNFYDVDSKEKLPTVFAAELEGALRISVENLRVRVGPEELCSSWTDFGGMRVTEKEDGMKELLSKCSVRGCVSAVAVWRREVLRQLFKCGMRTKPQLSFVDTSRAKGAA